MEAAAESGFLHSALSQSLSPGLHLQGLPCRQASTKTTQLPFRKPEMPPNRGLGPLNCTLGGLGRLARLLCTPCQYFFQSQFKRFRAAICAGSLGSTPTTPMGRRRVRAGSRHHRFGLSSLHQMLTLARLALE